MNGVRHLRSEITGALVTGIDALVETITATKTARSRYWASRRRAESSTV
jgi:hypothetical protein